MRWRIEYFSIWIPFLIVLLECLGFDNKGQEGEWYRRTKEEEEVTAIILGP